MAGAGMTQVLRNVVQRRSKHVVLGQGTFLDGRGEIAELQVQFLSVLMPQTMRRDAKAHAGRCRLCAVRYRNA